VIDRLAKAKAKNYDAEQLVEARNFLHSYKCKFGRERHAHAPTDEEVAKFLSVASWPQLSNLLYELMAERKEAGYSYAWFWTVALQRIHGIGPSEQRKIRTQLFEARRPRPAPAEQQPLLENVSDLKHAIAAAAAGKGMR
jgi:hypothetical protein